MRKCISPPTVSGKTPFQRFDALVHAVIRAPHVAAKPKPARRKPSR